MPKQDIKSGCPFCFPNENCDGPLCGPHWWQARSEAREQTGDKPLDPLPPPWLYSAHPFYRPPHSNGGENTGVPAVAAAGAFL
jgi:hypothetical protein